VSRIFGFLEANSTKSLYLNFCVSLTHKLQKYIALTIVSAGYILTFYPHHDISFDGNWFLRIMVPPIVFEAALSIDKRSFNRHIVPILLYAVLGTLVASGITAIVVHEGSKMLKGVCDTIPYPEALAFGSLISSIDPIAVLSVLSSMGMTDQDTIYVIIFGESLLNDGVAIVLFETLVHFLDDNMVVDGHAVAAAAIHFIVVFIGSLLIGIGYGLCCTLYYWIMIGCQTPLVEVLMFCCWALLPYYVCDGIAWSGIVAVVAAGFIMDIYVVGTEVLLETSNDETYLAHSNDFQNSNTSDSNKDALPSFPDIDSNNSNNHKERKRSRKRRRAIFSKEGLLSRGAKTHVVFVTEVISTMMETAIFAYLGLFLFSSRYHWNFYHVIIGITGCCLSRAIMIPSLSFVANWITRMQQSGSICRSQENHQPYYPDTHTNRQNTAAGVIVDSKMQLVLWFAGLRGAMSFALVEHILLYDAVSGEGTRLKSELKAMTSACIMFTLFFLGGSTFYMIEALGLSPKSRKESTKSEEEELEMMGLLGSTPASKSIDAEEIGIPEYDTDGAEIYKRCVRKSA
jgi:NhaP-type Na+/H+ or K+/H+ antiporter